MLSTAFALFCFLLAADCLETHVHGDLFVPDAILRISAQNISIGGIQRYTTLVNGSVPGPELRVSEGKVVWIRVYNDMTDRNTTMHWHGLAQAASPFSDGTPLASQWPIPPQHFFDYELQIPNDTAGTYFYHSHVGFQSVSASGSLIVEDRSNPPYKYDDERTITLQELFNLTDVDVEQRITADPLLWFGENNGFLVNGKTISDYGVIDNSTATLAVIEVDPGKTYRLRFIAATALSYTSFAFESHDGLEVIEADGHYTKPLSTDLMQMGSGQRFSVLLKTKSCDELEQSGRLDYYLQVETRERSAVATNYALLRYRDTCNLPESSVHHLPTDSYPSKKPIDLPPTISGFLDYQLQPLVPNNFPTTSQVTRRIVLNVQQFEDGYYVWRDSNVSWSDASIDSRRYTTPATPYLVSLYTNQTAYLPKYDAAIANGGVDPTTQTFPAKLGEVLEIVLQNIGSISKTNVTPGLLETHPWHAHGGHYYDLGGGPGAWSSEAMEARLQGTLPVLRDTTMLFRYNEATQPDVKSGWRAWRLRVQNPGVWMIHCHWLQHMIQGMQTVWVFGDAGDILKVPRREVEGFLTFGGDVYGNGTHVPERVHFSEGG
ncbi:multicopper oxidase [Melanomma pulvis-pyrius CBS 109.77]|uniref:Multicopper oxidase n=1 Tax=Melanomma pulvis-pyrius CBS 109.77 TaxID=1314802 RepID=A0A6A6WZ62_9PLEO|nr:multicopper oxidase [Melanomma pulvis-pyrius CBS 109.77]